MKAFNKIFVAVIAMIILIFAVFNLLFASSDNTDSGRPYRVEINRLVFEIEQSGFDSVDMSGCEYVTHIEKYRDKFYDSDSDYTIREINGVLYRFDYTTDMESDKSSVMLMVNIILGILSAMIIGVLIFIRIKILLPFENLTNVPYELSKGNLTCPIKEDKSRFFGRFIWGVDIKTPLSAIKLYSKALSKGLYDGREKQIEIAESINTKADEIESYVLQIITASREDFLSLEVEMGEFYLSELISKIKLYYTEKLRLIRTDFFVGSYMDRLLKGDLDRSVEVLQNVMENAIKYGDGKSIDIQISEEDGCLLITVRNSGCTLSENELPHIFESFWRGENAENEKGSGLGLYINRQLMHKMNGEIFAEIKDGFISVSMVFSKA